MPTTVSHSGPTWSATVYAAGDPATAREALRRHCLEVGLCVTLTPTQFIYSGGLEDGVAVGLVNYPRFPSTPARLQARAVEVARLLLRELCQRTALVVGPEDTVWLHPDDVQPVAREEDK